MYLVWKRSSETSYSGNPETSYSGRITPERIGRKDFNVNVGSDRYGVGMK